MSQDSSFRGNCEVLNNESDQKASLMLDASETIVIRAQWSTGGSQIIRTNSMSPIEDAFALPEFESSLTSSLVIVFKGQIINPIFSFHYYGIKSGDRLVCVAKKSDVQPKILHYLEQFSISQYHTPSRTSQAEAIRAIVRSRLEDLVYTRWELRDEFPRMIQVLLDEYEQMDSLLEEQQSPTVVPDDASVNETPIPTLWPRNCLSTTALFN
jgi:hypothetical protein